MSETKNIYTLQEVADTLRLTRQTIYNNVKSGRIKAAKFGKAYRVTKEELDRVLQNGFSKASTQN